MHIFYTPEIHLKNELSEEESIHAVKVLRLTEGEKILLIDGKGGFYHATITRAHHKRCAFVVDSEYSEEPVIACKINIAIAPTKNIDRIEWFVEKSTEIGINSISLLKCRYSERKDIKKERLNKILISAAKQSLKATIPELNDMQNFNDFVEKPFNGEKYIAHCYKNQERIELKDLYNKGKDVLILIGPEGDFSEEEVELAIKNGFRPISDRKSVV